MQQDKIVRSVFLKLFKFSLIVLLTLILPACADEYQDSANRIIEKKKSYIEFYAIVRYENGDPVGGAQIECQIFYIDDEKSGLDKMATREISLKTNTAGEVSYAGFGSLLRVLEVHGGGEWLYDRSNIQRTLRKPNNRGYDYLDDGVSSYYKPNPNRPAIFVLVRSNENTITEFPSRGGEDVYPDGSVVVNHPEVPVSPSITLR